MEVGWPVWGCCAHPGAIRGWLGLTAVTMGLERGLSPKMCRTEWLARRGGAGGGRGAPWAFLGGLLSSLLAWLVTLGS